MIQNNSEGYEIASKVIQEIRKLAGFGEDDIIPDMLDEAKFNNLNGLSVFLRTIETDVAIFRHHIEKRLLEKAHAERVKSTISV